MSDFHLFIGIAVLSAPVIIMLSIFSGVEEWRVKFEEEVIPIDFVVS